MRLFCTRPSSLVVAACALIAAGCSTLNVERTIFPPAVPATLRPGEDQVVYLELLATGVQIYECAPKNDQAGAFEWVFRAPEANLVDKEGKPVGRHYGGPTWEANDGSKVTGKQLAVAPGAAGSIPFQLVKAEGGTGAMKDVTYIQRVNTQGGVAPAAPCDAAARGTRITVPYSADYVFYKAG